MTTIDELLRSNPFPGLRPFDSSEADRFFGRRKQIDELIGRLEEVSFLAVAGASGSGKSSLVRAGLLKALEHRGSSTQWQAAVMRPGTQPIANLAKSLAPVLGRDNGTEASASGALYGRLALGGLGLVEAVALAGLPSNARVLIVVDQFEEIFRFKQMTDSDEASAFVKLLLNAAREPRSPVSVVITLRSEFLGFCADFRDLPEAINRGQYLVPKLTRDQRKEAIVKPVELRGFTIAPRLVQRLLNDVSDDFDDLPVMQHALTRMWNRWARTGQGERPIDLEDYEAVGTTSRALSNHADEAFESLPALAPVTEKVFRALTERTAEGAEIRRPLDFDRLCEIVGAERNIVETVVERFRQPDTAFLMPSQEVPLANNPAIDISHESLIRLWQRLRVWAQAEFESRVVLLRLVEAAQAYADMPRNQGNRDSLWRGQPLAKATEWWRSTKPTPAWIGLYTGGKGASARDSAERFLAASAEQARREKWRGTLQIVGLLGVLLALLASIVAFNLLKRATSRELAGRAMQDTDREPAVSVRFAAAALELDPDNDRAEYALRQSLVNLETAHAERILALGEPVRDARYSRDGTRLVAASGRKVAIFDTRSFDQLGPFIERGAQVWAAWLIADNTTLVTRTVDDQGGSAAQIQRIGDSNVRQISCKGDKNPVFTIAVGPDERHVAVGCYNGDIRVWESRRAEAAPLEFTHMVNEPVTITALAFSADGEYLAAGDANGIVTIRNLRSAAGATGFGVKDSPIRHAGAINDIGFHPGDPTLIATAAQDNSAGVWHLDPQLRRLELNEKKEPKRWVLRHERPVLRSQFAVRHDDAAPLFTVSDKTARLWVDPTVDPRRVRAHDDWIVDAHASADGELLVTASSDGTARIWSTRSGAPVAVLRGHRDSLTRAIISPHPGQVATAGMDGTVRLWRIRPPRLLLAATHWILSAALDPDATRIAVGEEGHGAILVLKGGAADTLASRQELEGPADQVTGFSWSRDGKLLVGYRHSYDPAQLSTAAIWSVESRKDITPRWLKESRAAVFSQAADELLTVNDKGQLAVWAVEAVARAEMPQPTIPPFGEGFTTAAMSPDGAWIAAYRDTGHKIELWKRGDLKAPAHVFEGHKGSIRSLQFSRDSKRFVTASADRTAMIWRVDSAGPHPEKILSGGHTAGLAWASFDPEGKRVATASADSTIRIWDVERSSELGVLRWHSEGVNQVQFSTDGKSILSASDDGTVKLGLCDACDLEAALAERVPKLATIPRDAQKEVEEELADAMRYAKPLTFFFSRGR